MRLITVSVLLAFFIVSGLTAKPFSFVITGNATGSEVGIQSGCDYASDPPFNNPSDPDNTRLIDGDRPSGWNAVAGINYVDQTVEFDLKNSYRLDAVAISFNDRSLPASVTISTAVQKDGPWTQIGVINKETESGGWWRLDIRNVNARFVKMFFKLDEWGWYIREVKIYGAPNVQEVGKVKKEGSSLVLVNRGKAYSSIVVADNPAENAIKAAATLQSVVRQMTGVIPPIVGESEYDNSSAAILVGASEIAKKNGIDVEQGSDVGDCYIIRTFPNGIALVGNDGGERRGSIYAVYDQLQRWGCGWFGPDSTWQVIPSLKKLSAKQVDVTERPTFEHRNIWMVKNQTMRDAWRLGGKDFRIGHALGAVVPRAEYEAEHPEYFGADQPCLTNPAVIKIAADGFRKTLDRTKDIVVFSVSPEDTGGFCECETCRATGNISARMLHFANAVARDLSATHPGRYLIGFYAYWYTHGAPNPAIKAEPGVCVIQVNEGNHVQPWEKPEPEDIARTTSRNNTRETTAFAAWKNTGAELGIYEWWIPGCGNLNWRSVPWYSGETALKNLRYWAREGVRYVTYETQYENGDGFPIRWPLYYMGARGMWNTKATSEKIMADACKKLFGKAAKPMRAFYKTIEDAMAASDLMGGNWHLPSPEAIYTPSIESKAASYLDKAAASTKDPAELERIRQEREMWDGARKIMAELRESKASTTYEVSVDDKVMKWEKGKISTTAIRSLLGLPDATPIYALELDGQLRQAMPDEIFDLSTKIKFVTEVE